MDIASLFICLESIFCKRNENVSYTEIRKNESFYAFQFDILKMYGSAFVL